MAEKIVMPKLAMAMKQGKVIEWKAEEGEWVEKGRIVMVIETEKVSHECESPVSGFLPSSEMVVPIAGYAEFNIDRPVDIVEQQRSIFYKSNLDAATETGNM